MDAISVVHTSHADRFVYHGTPLFVRTSRVLRVAVSAQPFYLSWPLTSHRLGIEIGLHRCVRYKIETSEKHTILLDIEYPGLGDYQMTHLIEGLDLSIHFTYSQGHKSSTPTSIRRFIPVRSCHIVSPNHHLSTRSSRFHVFANMLEYRLYKAGMQGHLEGFSLDMVGVRACRGFTESS